MVLGYWFMVANIDLWFSDIDSLDLELKLSLIQIMALQQ